MTFCNGSRGYEFKQDYTSDKLLVETSRHAVSNKLCRGCPCRLGFGFAGRRLACQMRRTMLRSPVFVLRHRMMI
jgi:hypothetical protein